MKHYNITITGKVQGVGFRYSAMHAAKAMGIKGFVRNIPNREVYIEAEGTEQQLIDFLAWCHKGPEYSRVANVSYYESDIQNFTEFYISK